MTSNDFQMTSNAMINDYMTVCLYFLLTDGLIHLNRGNQYARVCALNQKSCCYKLWKFWDVEVLGGYRQPNPTLAM